MTEEQKQAVREVMDAIEDHIENDLPTGLPRMMQSDLYSIQDAIVRIRAMVRGRS